ncbi:MAG: carboxypeptidase-like regulatory domain-containing protein, partial [Chitinophagaceae bacterium]|nr:carboxypeptidase-like regulatory domain-containing protein [Chitinophagaceae bacterium]
MRKREISFYPTISAWLLALSVLLFNQDVHAQRIPVSGTVQNADGQAIEGASVSVKGSSEKTITNAQGQFKITVPDRSAILVFSSLGFAVMERNLNGQTIINITLASEVKAIDEVVVVGFGTQRKVTVTGSISTVKSEEILRSPVSSVANAIAGRTTGVLAVQRGGEPGRDIADIYVRGIATFAGGNSTRPLVLVDGVERSLAGIDPYTIESFNILKDASATAVFGVRGANGVIIITTKTGQKGRPQFSFS